MSEEQNIEDNPNQSNQQPFENVNGNPSQENSKLPQTENMEVHKHPHHVTHKKKLGEYLFEFLMIFFAVVMGFIAENIREHFSEKKQISQYMQSMLNDLKSDINTYDSSMSQDNTNCILIDTLISDLKQHKNNGEAYYIARKLTISIGIISPVVKTLDQMKSTGAMRFIENPNISDSINSYYQWVKYFDYWSDLQKQRINSVIVNNDKLFDAAVFFSIYKKMDSSNDTIVLIPAGNPSFITNDPIAINAVMMQYQYLYGITKLMYKRSVAAKAQAQRLATLLQKENH